MAILLVLWGQRLRRDRWQLVSWVAAIGAFALFAAAAVTQTYGNLVSRTEILQVAIATPAVLMLRGLPRGVDQGAFTFFLIYAFLALLAGLMSTFLAVRHSRADEETGGAELVAATPAGRLLPNAATLLHGIAANILVALAVFAGFVAQGLDPQGSLTAGAATGAVGLAFLGVGLLVAQFMGTSRGANGVSAALVVLAYVLRGIGDATGTPGAGGTTMTEGAASWFSPIGWGQQTYAYSGNRAWPLLLPLGLAVACLAAAWSILRVRDSGASVWAARPGRAAARQGLRSPAALALRLQAGSIIGWGLGGLALGLLAGSLGKAIAAVDTPETNITAVMREMLQSQGTSQTQLMVSVLFSVAGVLAAACALQAVIRLRQEEAAGTAELLLAVPVGRVRWLSGYLVLGAAAVVLVVGLAGVGAWVTLTGSGDASMPADALWQTALAQLPAALIYLAVPALVFVLWPPATIAASWALLAVGVMLGIFGGMLGMDQSLRNLSPFTHTPVPHGADTDWSGAWWMLAIAAAAGGLAVAVMRRREVGSA
ncbi:ABC transporter permease [Arthrobacter liuii]|uniref:Exporter of polyketide antibiotics n=1 Tax=Arthrobacter liuii TaxID=1476996 RepID=A0ABQ2AKY7_9MICC|nr:ABC transporter permease subunit [Arthrobacter liuii]GGH91409.1 exporter of polyketide antibiotics [Arthrobacter liuii]